MSVLVKKKTTYRSSLCFGDEEREKIVEADVVRVVDRGNGERIIVVRVVDKDTGEHIIDLDPEDVIATPYYSYN